MPTRKKRWGSGSLEADMARLGRRIYDATAAGEEAYWKAVKKFFPEISADSDPFGGSVEFEQAQYAAIFEWLEAAHPDPRLADALKRIFGKQIPPEETKKWLEKSKDWDL